MECSGFHAWSRPGLSTGSVMFYLGGVVEQVTDMKEPARFGAPELSSDLARLGSPDEPQPPWQTINDLLDERGTNQSDKLAVFFFEAGISYTFAQLRAEAEALASGLAEHGVEKGSRVATLLQNSPEQLVTWLACSKVGALYAPFNYSLKVQELAHTIGECRPALLIVSPDRIEDAESGLRLSDYRCQTVVTGNVGGHRSFSDLSEDGAPFRRIEVHPEDGAALLFTGGTTGMPKAVIRSHFSYICGAVRYSSVMSPIESDRHIANGQLFHAAAQEVGFLGPLMAGIPSFWSQSFSANSFWARCNEVGATLTEMTGAILSFLVRQPPSPLDVRHKLRAIICAAHGLPPETRRDFQQRFGIRSLLDIYAMSETGMLLFSNTVSDQRVGSVGHPRGWCDVMIAQDNDLSTPAGEVGNILLRPALPFSMSSGYFGRDAATVALFRNCWLHTGDLGYLDDDGWLYFTGRGIDVVRRRGENVSVHEVETVLSEHPAIEESAVIGVPSEHGDQEMKAVVRLKQGSEVSPVEIYNWCEQHLASFKLPRYIAVTATALPRSATKGEVERHKLGELGEGATWDREQ